MRQLLLDKRLTLSLCDDDIETIDELAFRLGIIFPTEPDEEDKANRSAAVRNALQFVGPLLDILDTITTPRSLEGLEPNLIYRFKLGQLLDAHDIHGPLAHDPKDDGEKQVEKKPAEKVVEKKDATANAASNAAQQTARTAQNPVFVRRAAQ